MDRNQAKELLPIIKAFSEEKTIQSRCIKGDTSLWYDDEDPSFDNDFEYRIKPESKYRPFKGCRRVLARGVETSAVRVGEVERYRKWVLPA
jgi:hypothetical protein